MPKSIDDRVIGILLEVAETTKSRKLKLAAVDKVQEIRAKRPKRGPKPAPEPMSETDRLLGITKP